MFQNRITTPYVLLWFVVALIFSWGPILLCSGAIFMQVGQYPARVYTNAPPGVPVVRVTAYDNATGFLTNFQLENKNDANFFTIGTDGMIRTARDINFDVGRSFEFFVYALYNQKADYKHVKILVSERNLVSPKFTNATYSFPVYRYGVGDTIGVVSATDADEEPYNSKFNIYAEGDQAALNYVDVDRSGVIKLVRRIPESMDMLDLKVTAMDMGSPPKSGVAVVVIDIIMVKHPNVFCLSTTKTSSTLCWKNPMPEREFSGYIVAVNGDVSRTDKIPLIAGHSEACYKLDGTVIGNTYVFSVKVDTNDFWYGQNMDLVHKKTGIGATESCVAERFSTCSYRNPCKNGGECNPGGFSDTALEGDDSTTSLDYSCLCLDGWSGYNCTVKDVCGSNPCGDFGSCVPVGEDRYQCQCQDGYFGDGCQHYNACLKAPCMNEGACNIHSDGNYTCQCLPNFSGPNCENPDPCTPDPCFLGQGTCIVVSDKVKQCKCNEGFYGERCEHEDVCVTSPPCLNGGTCARTQEGYACECRYGKLGKNCELNDPCVIEPCQNGGTCRVTDTGEYLDYHCDCLPGDYGPECQYQRDTSCLGVNCNNGTCVFDDFQKNKCVCDKGYDGDFCEKFNVCLTLDNSCSGRGTCVSVAPVGGDPSFMTQYTCECNNPYHGIQCEETNMCYPKVCSNGGNCVAVSTNLYDCRCPNGMNLEVCPTDACNPNRCRNFGQCTPLNGADYSCTCTEDWLGDNCDVPNPCSDHNNRCENNSSCTVVDLGQQIVADCQCSPSRLGKFCQLNNPCQVPRCVHGTCVVNPFAEDIETDEMDVDYTTLFTCQCSQGYTGAVCDMKSCEGVRCENNGTCKDGKCVCQSGFAGTYCEGQISQCIDGQSLDNPRCYCEGGHIKCRSNDCAPGQIELSPASGEKFCLNETYVNVNSSVLDIVIRCCYKVCQLYLPTCENRTHCSPNNQPDTVCQYFNSRCTGGEKDCDKYAEEKMSCLDLRHTGDREWMACATERLLGMKEDVKNPSHLTASQVADYGDAVVGQLGSALEDTKIAQIAIDVVGSLSDVNVSVSREAERQNGTNKRLRRFLDDYTAKVNLNNGSVTMATDGLVLEATSMDAFNDGQITFEPSYNSSPVQVSITLPKEALEAMKKSISKDSRLQFIGYKKSQLFTPKYGDDDLITVDDDVIRGQRVISASVTGVVVQNLTEPVRIDLPAIEKGVNHTCVFWDENNSSWSDSGVRTIYDSKTGTFTCLSDHLTSFAVIMSPTPEALRGQIGLTYITYIGSGVSMGCLFLTILTYGLFRCLYGEKSGKVLLHLCTSLLLLNVVFLVGSVDVSDYSDDVCTAIAILLHYFVLSTLWWMLVEAIEMYRAIVIVFTKYERFYMLKRCLVGWGIPVVIVAATASVDIDYYGMNTVDEDGNEDTKICFMTPGGDNIAYYTSLLAPACLIVLVNTVVFILVARVILRPRFQQQITSNTAPFTPAQVRGAFTVMFLLGVTWIFGPLAIGEAALVFSYLFCISNSLQGCLIFVFRCLFNPEARLAWIQLLKTGTLKKRRGPIKSKYVDSSSSKDGQDSSTTRRLSNSANTNLTTSTNFSSGPNSSMKLPLFRGTNGGIHAHPHQLHTTNGWHPNLNGLKREKAYGNGNDCAVSVSVSSGSGGGGGRGSRSGSSGGGSDLMDMSSTHSSKHDQSMEKEELKACDAVSVGKEESPAPDAPGAPGAPDAPDAPDAPAGFNDEFTHL